MNWNNPWRKRDETKQMSSVRVNKKTKERWAMAMRELFGVNWQYHHGEHFSKALEMYLDFLENLSITDTEDDMKDKVSCNSLINMLENDMGKEIRLNKGLWIKYRKKNNNEKAAFYDGIVKGLNICFHKTKMIRTILNRKE